MKKIRKNLNKSKNINKRNKKNKRNKQKRLANESKSIVIAIDQNKYSNFEVLKSQNDSSSNLRDEMDDCFLYDEKSENINICINSIGNTRENTFKKNASSETSKNDINLSFKCKKNDGGYSSNSKENILNNIIFLESNKNNNCLNPKNQIENNELTSNQKNYILVRDALNGSFLIEDDSSQEWDKHCHIFNNQNNLEDLAIDENELYYIKKPKPINGSFLSEGESPQKCDKYCHNFTTQNNLEDLTIDGKKVYYNKKPKPINLSVYNKDEYNKGNYLNNIFEEPQFYPLEKYIFYIKDIISEKNGIFNGENDFRNCIGKIYNNILNILVNNGTNELESNLRPLQMAKKYKAFILEQMIQSTNKLLLENINYKNYKLEKINKNTITEEVNSGFVLNLFPKKIYSMLSNDLTKENKKKNNYKIIKTIIDEYNNNLEETPLIEHLCLTFEDCLNIILGLKEDEKKVFHFKIKDLINRVYKTLEIDEKKYPGLTKKDYIAGFILLGYNLKKFYCKIEKREARNKNVQKE